MRSFALASLLAAFVPPATTLTSTGCFGCTDIGYENGLRIDVEVPAAPASYRIEVEADGEVLGLEYEVTDPGGIACAGGSGCNDIGQRFVLRESVFAHSSKLVLNLHDAENEGGPDEVVVRVFRGGQMLSEDAFDPRYEVDEPAGRGCGDHVHAELTIGVL